MHSSSVYKRPTRSSPIRRSAANLIRSILSLWSSKRISLPQLNLPRYGFYEFWEDFFPSFGCVTDTCLDKNKDLDFFKTLAPVFELYSRFSKVQPVPGLGHIDSSKEEVEGFYDFWYNFDSWRSFEWLDKEVNEGSDRYVFPNTYLGASDSNFCNCSRDDKRYTEKKNKSERARRKKEDIAKLRGLVDMTLG